MLLTPAQAAEILGVSVAAMRRYARDEVVKARKIGAKFGVGEDTVYLIHQRQTWRHVE